MTTRTEAEAPSVPAFPIKKRMSFLGESQIWISSLLALGQVASGGGVRRLFLGWFLSGEGLLLGCRPCRWGCRWERRLGRFLFEQSRQGEAVWIPYRSRTSRGKTRGEKEASKQRSTWGAYAIPPCGPLVVLGEAFGDGCADLRGWGGFLQEGEDARDMLAVGELLDITPQKFVAFLLRRSALLV